MRGYQPVTNDTRVICEASESVSQTSGAASRSPVSACSLSESG